MPHQQPQTLIVTDLDGTLLDHHTYSWQAAKPALKAALNFSVPVIACTSKTYNETIKLVKELALDAPFIFENGSGIAMPDGRIVPLAPTYEHQLHRLDQLKRENNFSFKGFNEMNIDEIVKETGLPFDNAEKAKARLFSEPFLWQGEDKHLKAFKQAASQLNINIVKGGRFFHALEKGVSKQQATNQLMPLLNIPNAHIVALGDGDNDIPLLSAADTAIVINNPTKSFPCIKKHNNLNYTSAYGPEGWNIAILKLLENRYG